ncbi:MAG: hypothetical protein DBX93_01910 [Oscillospiraceae bacterium]|nr:MAG: hypothetical protein DBX93_07955 [Oscillospiraceae bacterium]PWM56096.1 MAG: hypothetical protein DBX93_05650 [Oscillospiraceae bacterium]PWM58076.1 MAG: hypothetical protein DBX93_01910 [Oscillospiraceae bacterium]
MKIGDEVYVLDTWRGEKYRVNKATVCNIRSFTYSAIRLAEVRFLCGGTGLYVVGFGAYETPEEAEDALKRHTCGGETHANTRKRRFDVPKDENEARKRVLDALGGE